MTFQEYMDKQFKDISEGRIRLEKETEEQTKFINKVNTQKESILCNRGWKDHISKLFNPIKTNKENSHERKFYLFPR